MDIDSDFHIFSANNSEKSYSTRTMTSIWRDMKTLTRQLKNRSCRYFSVIEVVSGQTA